MARSPSFPAAPAASARRPPNSFSRKARRSSSRAPARPLSIRPRPSCRGIEVVLSNAGDIAATKALVDQVKAKHGRIDVLFVNAGIAKFAPIAAVDETFYDSQFDVNVKGAFFLLKHAEPVVTDGGAIILTASVGRR